MQRKIEMYRRYRDRDKLSLNEERRWQEYRQEKAAEEADEKVSGTSRNKQDEEFDPVLDEAEHIASDLAELDKAANL